MDPPGSKGSLVICCMGPGHVDLNERQDADIHDAVDTAGLSIPYHSPQGLKIFGRMPNKFPKYSRSICLDL